MVPPNQSRALFRFTVLVVLATLGLVCIGGLVTSKGVGMSVPDWPTSFGYNMFALPVSTWMTGGIFDEHTHRLWASTVGLLVVLLTRWIGGIESRKSLAIIGLVEFGMGLTLVASFGIRWKGEGHFLMGIGSVVLLAAACPWKSLPTSKTAIRLSWLAFWLVQAQGSLGGLRVVLDHWAVAGTTGGVLFGMIHGCLGQLFFALVAALAIHLSSAWKPTTWQPVLPLSLTLPVLTLSLVFGQLLLGLLMRHQHAGLAVHDLPLAYGQVWPDLAPEDLARYSRQRDEIEPVTAFQIRIHVLHRINAIVASLAVLTLFLKTRFLPKGHLLSRLSQIWLALIGVQFLLGILTVYWNKPADIATAHVAVGTLSLATGLISFWVAALTCSNPFSSVSSFQKSSNRVTPTSVGHPHPVT